MMTRDQALVAGGVLAVAVLVLTQRSGQSSGAGYDPGMRMNQRMIRSKANPDFLASGVSDGTGSSVAAPPDQLLHPLALDACLMAPHPLYAHAGRMSPAMSEVQARGWSSWIFAPPSEQDM